MAKKRLPRGNVRGAAEIEPATFRLKCHDVDILITAGPGRMNHTDYLVYTRFGDDTT